MYPPGKVFPQILRRVPKRLLMCIEPNAVSNGLIYAERLALLQHLLAFKLCAAIRRETFTYEFDEGLIGDELLKRDERAPLILRGEPQRRQRCTLVRCR